MAKPTTEEALAKITTWLADTYRERLQCLIAYGSAAGGNHHGQHSDINLLAVLDRMDAATLDAADEAVRWWVAQGNPPPVMLSRDEQDDAADVFAIEYLDIQHNHRLLHGEDLFAHPPRFPELHRLQVEHDLRAKLIRLRGAYMRVRADAQQLEAVLLESVSTFLTLFRHALVAVGEPLRVRKDEVLAAAAARFEIAAGPFDAILQARLHGGRVADGKLDGLRQIFADYLGAIQQVERALEEASHGQ